MTQTANVQPLRIADAARGIRHVFIRNLEVLAQIGVYGHEQGKLQPVRINVDLAVEDVIAVEDKLEKVVDYAASSSASARSSPKATSTSPKRLPSASRKRASTIYG